MNCPNTLQTAANFQRLALFVGSGISASATNRANQHPPTWTELLTELSSLAPHATRKRIQALIEANHLLQAAELLRYIIRK